MKKTSTQMGAGLFGGAEKILYEPFGITVITVNGLFVFEKML